MKTLAILLLIIPVLTSGQNPFRKESNIVVEAIAKSVTRDMTEFEVRLYDGNELVEIIEPYKKKNRFAIYLERGKQYMLEVSAPNHYPKRISINTRQIPSYHKKIWYDFDVYVFAKEHFETVTDDVLDFPYALLHYNYETKTFAYAERYTKRLSKEYRKLLLEADKRHSYGL